MYTELQDEPKNLLTQNTYTLDPQNDLGSTNDRHKIVNQLGYEFFFNSHLNSRCNTLPQDQKFF